MGKSHASNIVSNFLLFVYKGILLMFHIQFLTM